VIIFRLLLINLCGNIGTGTVGSILLAVLPKINRIYIKIHLRRNVSSVDAVFSLNGVFRYRRIRYGSTTLTFGSENPDAYQETFYLDHGVYVVAPALSAVRNKLMY
jgi:hypothetical protein